MKEEIIKRFKITSKLGEELINSILYIIKNFQEENPNLSSVDINFMPFEQYIENEILIYLQKLRKFNFEFLEKIKKHLMPRSESKTSN